MNMISQNVFCDHNERRLNEDRRRTQPFFINRYSLLQGRRRGGRRQTDSQERYIDRYNFSLFIFISIILVLCILDGYFTIYNVFCMRIPELNPIMDFFIQRNIPFFFLIKYALTSIGLIFICVHINFRFMRMVLGAIFFLYILILCSHLYILFFLSIPIGV